MFQTFTLFMIEKRFLKKKKQVSLSTVNHEIKYAFFRAIIKLYEERRRKWENQRKKKS